MTEKIKKESKKDEKGTKELKEKIEKQEKKKQQEEIKNEDEKERLEIKISKEVWVVISIVIATILAIILIIYFSKNAGKFEYNGIPFQKEYTGQILFYAAKVPVVDVYGRQIGINSIDFRNDPRKLEDIPVDIEGKIRFVKDKTVYITYSDLKQCDYNGVAAINLGRFLSNAGLNVKGAVMNESLNNSRNPYVTCSLFPENTVIEVKNGDMTKVIQTGKNCYEIISKDCEILKATEKFQLTVIEQYIEEMNNL